MGEAADMAWDRDYISSEHEETCEAHKIKIPLGNNCSLCEEGVPPGGEYQRNFYPDTTGH
jgi:hypothetical protein